MVHKSLALTALQNVSESYIVKRKLKNSLVHFFVLASFNQIHLEATTKIIITHYFAPVIMRYNETLLASDLSYFLLLITWLSSSYGIPK